MLLRFPRRKIAPFALALAGSVGVQEPARSQTLAETSVEVRTQLFFRISDAAAQRLLPPGWQANPAASGPAQGANLIIVLTDRLVTQDAEGRPIPGGAGQALVVAVPGRNPATGGAGPVVVAGFTSSPEASPGPYGVYVPAAITFERTVTASADGVHRGQERWSLSTGEGERFELRMRHVVATPTRGTLQQRAYSGRNGEFHRIYQIDQGTSLLRAAGTERVEDFAFSAAGPRLGSLFDGSEQLVSVLSLPWYVRRVSLP